MAHAPRIHDASPVPRDTRRRTRLRAATAVAAIGGVALTGLGGMSAAGAAEALSCSTVYAINASDGAGSTLWSVDTDTGAQTRIGTMDAGADGASLFNGLGVDVTDEHPQGVAYAMRWDSWTTQAGAFLKHDIGSGATTVVPTYGMPAGWAATQTHGAFDPSRSLFFHGAMNGGRLILEARDTTGAARGRLSIAFPTVAAAGANGDIAFDRDGNLYIVTSSANDATIHVVDSRDVAPAASAPTARAAHVQSFRVDDTEGLGVNGIAFGDDGYLLVSTTLELLRVDPMAGTVTSQVTFEEKGVVDIASCASPSHLTLEKDFPDGRASGDDQDQVRLTVSGSGLPATETTTTGSAIGIQARRVTVPVLPGATLALQESGTGADAERYRSSWVCIDDGDGTALAEGDGTTGSVTVPRNATGVGIRCTFVNTPRPAHAITLHKSADRDIAAVGDRVVYAFEVTNTGLGDLHDVVVAETEFSGSGAVPTVTCPTQPLSLAAGETVTCTADYDIEQSDVDRGTVENTATATGTSSDGESVASLPSTAVVTGWAEETAPETRPSPTDPDPDPDPETDLDPDDAVSPAPPSMIDGHPCESLAATGGDARPALLAAVVATALTILGTVFALRRRPEAALGG